MASGTSATVLALATFLSFAAGQNPCVTPSGETGTCEPIFKCNALLDLASEASPAAPVTADYSFCGMDKATGTVHVCCPSRGCSTPDGARGTCVELESCPRLTNTLQPPASLAAIKLVHAHICAHPQQDKVCCVSEVLNPYPVSIDERGYCQMQALPWDMKCCGYHGTTSPKTIGAYATEIDEYPWLALIEYEGPGGNVQPGCGGALISGQYVLTAAQCVVTFAKIVSVRLGEYNTSNSGPDYVLTASSRHVHNHGAISVPINEIIPHPGYDNRTERNNIAIIKLAKIVEYTDFIRPICLPTEDFTMRLNPANVELYAAGWAFTRREATNDIKFNVRLRYVPNEICQSSTHYDLYKGIRKDQFCSGSEPGIDICQGDMGGPLMRNVNGRHELAGIISFVPPELCTEGVPIVNTNVFHYLTWLRNKM